MALIAGIDIGNATTEVALAEISTGATPVFLASSIVPTTGRRIATVPSGWT